jgi:hypothetical protein
MGIQTQHELENTRVKLRQIEDRYVTLSAEPVETGQEKVREWTLLSLRKLINQFNEEIARFESRVSTSR